MGRDDGGNAGILLQTTAELDVLYAHLREIFVVTDEEEGQDTSFAITTRA